MLRHKKSAHSERDPNEDMMSNIDSEEDAMSDVSVDEDIFGPIEDNESSHSDNEDDASVTSEKSLMTDPLDNIVDEAFQKCQSQYDSMVNELLEDDTDISLIEAKERAFRKMKSTYRKALMNSFGSKVVWFEAMKKDPIYKSIKKTVNRLIDTDGYDKEEALKYGILKRQFLFDKVLNSYEIPELEGQDAMEHQEDSE
jgi:hypothetical protein